MNEVYKSILLNENKIENTICKNVDYPIYSLMLNSQQINVSEFFFKNCISHIVYRTFAIKSFEFQYD